MAHSREYDAYLASDKWKNRARVTILLKGEKCERCGSAIGLEVHHLTYENLGREKWADLLVVCRACHVKEDAMRADRTASRRWSARVDAWATKRYGEDVYSWPDDPIIEEEFEKWLETQED